MSLFSYIAGLLTIPAIATAWLWYQHKMIRREQCPSCWSNDVDLSHGKLTCNNCNRRCVE